jgi:hypothetical protein
MKPHLIKTVKRLNVEHRTFNFERPILMALRFIYLKQANRCILQGGQVSQSRFALLGIFLNRQNTVFDLPEADKCLLASGELDVRCSTFLSFFFRSIWPLCRPALPSVLSRRSFSEVGSLEGEGRTPET